MTSLFSDALLQQAATLITRLKERNQRLALAESCTGGLVCALLTEISGASFVLECGLIVYSNQAKQELLGVSWETLKQFGAVSAETAKEMAMGALERSRADIAVSITGVAGPDGGSPHKPVGRVYFGGCKRTGASITLQRQFQNLGRSAIRQAAAAEAFALTLQLSGIEDAQSHFDQTGSA